MTLIIFNLGMLGWLLDVLQFENGYIKKCDVLARKSIGNFDVFGWILKEHHERSFWKIQLNIASL